MPRSPLMCCSVGVQLGMGRGVAGSWWAGGRYWEASWCPRALPNTDRCPGQRAWGTGGQRVVVLGPGSRTGCSYYRLEDMGLGVQQVPWPVGSVSQLSRLTVALFWHSWIMVKWWWGREREREMKASPILVMFPCSQQRGSPLFTGLNTPHSLLNRCSSFNLYLARVVDTLCWGGGGSWGGCSL